jgi:hypothetical protein
MAFESTSRELCHHCNRARRLASCNELSLSTVAVSSPAECRFTKLEKGLDRGVRRRNSIAARSGKPLSRFCGTRTCNKFRCSNRRCSRSQRKRTRDRRPIRGVSSTDSTARLSALIIIWCGIGEASKILVLWLAMFPSILIAATAGVKTAHSDRVDAALSLGASQTQVLRLVILPSALPSILTGVRIGLGGGWSTLVAAEVIAATRGLGFMIQSAAQFLVTGIVVGHFSNCRNCGAA